MKKQKQTTIKPSEMTQMVNEHKVRQVSPPQEASRGENGLYSISKAEAARHWFKAAKGPDPSKGFLGVESHKVDEKSATDKEMLYKGKKKS